MRGAPGIQILFDTGRRSIILHNRTVVISIIITFIFWDMAFRTPV